MAGKGRPGRPRKPLGDPAAKGTKSAYRLLQDRKRQEAKRKPITDVEAAARHARLASEPAPKTNQERLNRKKQIKDSSVRPLYCGAKKKRSNERCRLPAGFRTNHYGQGRCLYHGGASPSHMRKAEKEGAIKAATTLFGAPKEINPLDAIIWCIQIKAGEVEWLSQRIADLAEKDLIENSIAGRRFNIHIRQRDEATKALVDYSQTAVRLGLAERAVKLAEQYGEMLANLIKGILDDLDLSVDQKRNAPAIIRRHLILVQGGIGKELPAGVEPVIDGDAEKVA